MDLIGRHKNTGKQTDRQISRQAKTHAGRQKDRQAYSLSVCLLRQSGLNAIGHGGLSLQREKSGKNPISINWSLQMARNDSPSETDGGHESSKPN